MKKYMDDIKPYTLKELAEFYEVSAKIFRNWLRPFRKQIGKKEGHFFTVNQVKIILDKLGAPTRIREG